MVCVSAEGRFVTWSVVYGLRRAKRAGNFCEYLALVLGFGRVSRCVTRSMVYTFELWSVVRLRVVTHRSSPTPELNPLCRVPSSWRARTCWPALPPRASSCGSSR